MVAAVGRKIAKEHRARQTPHGKQTVKQLMRHGVSTNSLELSGDTKSFDRVARKWNVDYAFYKTGPAKYLLFFKAGQAGSITHRFLGDFKKGPEKAKSQRIPLPEFLQRGRDQLTREKPKQRERVKEAVHENG